MKINKLFLLSILSCSLLSAMKKDYDDRSPKRKREAELSKSLVKKVKLDKGKEHIEDNLEDTENYDLINYFYNLPDELILKIANYVFYDETFKKAFKNYINFSLTDKKLYFTLNDKLFKKEQLFKLANFFPPYNIAQKLGLKFSSKLKKILLNKLIKKYDYNELDLVDWLNNNKGIKIFDLIKTKAADSIIGTLALLNSGIDVNYFYKNHIPIKLAAMNGPDDIFKLLMYAGADVNIANKKGITPLIEAINKDNLGLVENLLSKGAEIDLADENGKTPLMYAAERRNIDLVFILISNGAKTDTVDENGSTPLHYLFKKSSEFRKKRIIPIINDLIAAGLSINAQNKHGLTPLMTAVKNHYDVQFIRKLLQKGANLNLTDNKGKTALMHAVGIFSEKIINLLLNFDAEIDKRCKNGKTALMYLAAKQSHLPFIALLKKGANVNLCDNNGKTALMYVASNPYGENRAKALLEKKADLNSKDNTGKTALMYAASSGQVELVKLFISAGANLDLKDNEGKTAADYATNEEIKNILSSETYRLLFLN